MRNVFLISIRILFPIYLLSVCLLCFANLAFPQEMDIPKFILGIPVDKIVHFTMFLPYPILAIPFFNLSKMKDTLKFRICTTVFFAGIVFAAITELIQKYLLIDRNGDIWDFAADIFGMSAGLLLFLIIYPPLSRKFRYVITQS
ncbi:MAG: VanZ family protein [Alistipes sp.]|nr:VanZ family protein [Candidatus Minthomonas equi]